MGTSPASTSPPPPSRRCGSSSLSRAGLPCRPTARWFVGSPLELQGQFACHGCGKGTALHVLRDGALHSSWQVFLLVFGPKKTRSFLAHMAVRCQARPLWGSVHGVEKVESPPCFPHALTAPQVGSGACSRLLGVDPPSSGVWAKALAGCTPLASGSYRTRSNILALR